MNGLTHRLPPRMRRWLALGLLVAAVGCVWTAALEPVLDTFVAQRQELTESAALLARYRGLDDVQEDLRNQVTMRKERWRDQPGLFDAGNPAVAIARLQTIVQGYAAMRQVRVTSMQPLPEVAEGRLQRIGLRVELTADIRSLHSFLRDVETGQPFLFTEALAIQASGAGPGPAGRADTLAVRCDLIGYARSAS